MKSVRIFAVLFLLAFIGFACSKDNKTPENGAGSVIGIWEGKWGDIGQSPTNFIRFEFKSGGQLVRLNEQNQVIANGNWKLQGIELQATYTHTSDGQKHSITGLYTDFNGEFTGTWGYGNSKADGGTLDMKKK